MWTAQLQQINKDSVKPTAVVLFTDGAKYKRLETIDLNGMTPTSFKSRVESLRANFEASFGFIDALDVAFDLTPAPITPVIVDPQVGKRMALAAALTDLNIKLIDQATYDSKVQEILNAK